MSTGDDLGAAVDPISPELALVAPELRERAIAALPPVELYRPLPFPPRPVPPVRAPLVAVLAGIVRLGVVALVACTLVVLVLTEVADAVR